VIWAGCSQSTKTGSDWQRLKSNLYNSPDGEIGFASRPSLANIPILELSDAQCPNQFLTYIGGDYTTKLSDVVDVSSFEYIGSSYYQDKNRIYNHYGMCDGGYLNIFSEDKANLRLLNDSYVCYKGRIYHNRGGQMDADVTSFETNDKYLNIARDKDGYFEFYERVSIDNLRESLGDELFESLEW
jgi:hypothetical protein